MASPRPLGVGDRLPEASFPIMTAEGPDTLHLGDLMGGARIVLVGVPGAYTPTCDGRHLPGFVRLKPEFDAKGIDRVMCVSVNDVHVMRLWGETTGATAAGIVMLPDPASDFTRAAGFDYDKPEVGFYARSRRYALVAEDGVITHLQLEEGGACALSTAEDLLAVL